MEVWGMTREVKKDASKLPLDVYKQVIFCCEKKMNKKTEVCVYYTQTNPMHLVTNCLLVKYLKVN